MLVTTRFVLPLMVVLAVLIALLDPSRAARIGVITAAVVEFATAGFLFVRGSRAGLEVLAVPPLVTGLMLVFLFGFLRQSVDRVTTPAKVFAGAVVVTSLATAGLGILLSIRIS